MIYLHFNCYASPDIFYLNKSENEHYFWTYVLLGKSKVINIYY